MISNTKTSASLDTWILIVCTLLALTATSLSLLITGYSGRQMAGSPEAKLIMVGISMLAVLCVHLFPVICRRVPICVRFAGILIWLPCMAFVCYSHALFFLSSQQQAGIIRAETINQSSLISEPKRNLMSVLMEQAKIKSELVAKSQIPCVDGCVTLRTRLENLRNRLDVLSAESDDVKRWQLQQDRQESLRDAARDDPVLMRLAILLHVTFAQMGLVMSITFFVVLEGAGCFCWYVAQVLRTSPMIQPVETILSNTSELTNLSNTGVTLESSELDRKVEEITQEVLAGRLKLTVKGVRDHCSCAQNKASELKRKLQEKLNGGSHVY